MHFIFLGTSSGTPSKTRNVSALAFRFQGQSLWSLFDCGEGTQHRILNTPLSLHKLEQIFISHLHGDHLFGLPGLLATRALNGGTKPLEIYGPVGIKEFIETVVKVSGLHLTFDCNIHEIEGQRGIGVFKNADVATIPLSHGIASFAFVVREYPRPGPFNADLAKEKGIPAGPLFGKLKKGNTVILPDGRTFEGTDFIGKTHPGRTVIVGGDNDDPGRLLDDLENADVLIHEATYTEKTMKASHTRFQHSTAKSVARIAQKCGVLNLVLTHISPRFADQAGENKPSAEDILREAKERFSGNLFLANDFDEYVLDGTGTLRPFPITIQ